jgi:tetratricopeptide (TPR) repeat protein
MQSSRSHPAYLLLLLVSGWAFFSLGQEARGESCASSHQRPPRLEELAFFEDLKMLAGQGMTKLAIEGQSERPKPKISLIDMKRALARSALNDRRKLVPDVLLYAVHNTNYSSLDPEVLNLPFSTYWCIVSAGDLVLLSDMWTDHWTRVFAAPHGQNSIILNDLWPDQNFLQSGHNAADIHAEVLEDFLIPGKKLLKIEKEEFERVFIGAISLNTPGLADAVILNLPANHPRSAVYMSLGEAFLRSGSDRLAPFAVDALKGALVQARDVHDQNATDRIASRMFVALSLSMFVHEESGDSAGSKKYQRELMQLTGRHTVGKLVDAAGSQDLFVLANAAGRARQFEIALAYFDGAVFKNPDFEDAYIYRAQTLLRIGTSSGDMLGGVRKLIQDTSRAIDIINKKLQSRTDRHLIYMERGVIGLEQESADMQALVASKVLALRTRGSGYVMLRNFDAAVEDGKLLVALAPRSPVGHQVLASAEAGRGQIERAKAHLYDAARLETDPARQQLLRRQADSL